MDVTLEYRPCNCGRFDQPRPEGDDEREAVVTGAPEHYDREGIAARRLRQLLEEGKPTLVHHLGLHVSAAIINGVRFAE